MSGTLYRSALEAVELTASFLCSRVWYLGAPGEHPSAYHVRLRPDGAIAGWSNDDDRSWELAGGQLVFRNGAGRCTVRFDHVWAGDGRLELLGRPTEAAMLDRPRLMRCREPIAELRKTPPEEVKLKIRPGVRRRSNLVVLRADERSLHANWPRIPDEERNWDLCISFYGNPDNAAQDPIAEYQLVQNAAQKYWALYDLFYEGSPLWRYNWIAFPDDDMITSWQDINEMFVLCQRHNLLLAQPALTGHVSHPITKPNDRYLLRYTSFVEAIAPWFSREALELCAPTFKGTRSGWGLDHIWPKLLGEPSDRLAIIDKITFEHTRPVASAYNVEEAAAEAWHYQMIYAAFPKQVEFGGLLRTPADRRPET